MRDVIEKHYLHCTSRPLCLHACTFVRTLCKLCCWGFWHTFACVRCLALLPLTVAMDTGEYIGFHSCCPSNIGKENVTHDTVLSDQILQAGSGGIMSWSGQCVRWCVKKIFAGAIQKFVSWYGLGDCSCCPKRFFAESRFFQRKRCCCLFFYGAQGLAERLQQTRESARGEERGSCRRALCCRLHWEEALCNPLFSTPQEGRIVWSSELEASRLAIRSTIRNMGVFLPAQYHHSWRK